MNPSRLETLQKFLEEAPDDPFNHYALALEYLSRQDLQQSLTLFEAALRVDPTYVPAHHQLGLLLAQMGRKEDALKRLEQGIQAAELIGDTHASSEMQDAIDALETDE